MVQPGVFSPKNTVSTKVFLDFISNLDLKNKRVLELGCGSGIISVFAASQEADVWASDINLVAIESLENVKNKLELNVTTIHSDIFDELPEVTFDYIFINPPYYPQKPENISEQAWFCGAEYEFFEKLFKQLSIRVEAKTEVLMILSDACNFVKIQNIADNNGLVLSEVYSKPLTFEINYIYSLQKV
jgi:release factor glutamine methyltransferase